MSILIFFIFLFSACTDSSTELLNWNKIEIAGRDEKCEMGFIRRNVYKAKIPSHWVIETTTDSLSDSTKANIRLYIQENGELLTLTFHTFVSSELRERIPPEAQIARWQNQINHRPHKVYALSRNGYAGYCFEAENVLSWAMQLDPEIFQKILFIAESFEEKEHAKQLAADFTLKVVGSKLLLQKYKKDLRIFMTSIERIS